MTAPACFWCRKRRKTSIGDGNQAFCKSCKPNRSREHVGADGTCAICGASGKVTPGRIWWDPWTCPGPQPERPPVPVPPPSAPRWYKSAAAQDCEDEDYMEREREESSVPTFAHTMAFLNRPF